MGKESDKNTHEVIKYLDSSKICKLVPMQITHESHHFWITQV